MTRAEFYEYKENTFDSFSKTVIKNIGVDLYRKKI